MKRAWIVSILLHGAFLGVVFGFSGRAGSISASRRFDVDLLDHVVTAPRRGSSATVRSVASARREELREESAAMTEARPADDATLEAAGDFTEYRPAPAYPLAAQEAGIEGEILLEIQADEKGRVTEIRMVKSSGHAVLDESVVATVKTWRLRPRQTVRVPVNFRLET